jgi:hypothetical protein
MCLNHDGNTWNASLNIVISVKFCTNEFLVVNHVQLLNLELE